jgi:hypothetical protein
MANTPAKSSSSNVRNLVLMALIALLAMAGGIFLANRGLVNLFSAPQVQSANPVPVGYEQIVQYLDRDVTVSGYIIIPNNTDTVCFVAWPTCKMWLDNDPAEAGLGQHEIEVSLGDGPNEITAEGVLYDRTGRKIPLVENSAFSWYHVTVSGKVINCKDGNCVIEVYEVNSKR